MSGPATNEVVVQLDTIGSMLTHSVDELLKARHALRALQELFLPHGDVTVDAGQIWHVLETIDDHLHNALGKLGD
jgi:hypothetical protein